MSSVKRVLESLRLMGSMRDVIRDSHGNVSALDKTSDLVWIKPSGMQYDQISSDDVCGIILKDGCVLSSNAKIPSVDTVHHRSIYMRHPWVGAICHTHSPYAVGWSMLNVAEIPVCCTEHADYFGHPIRIVGTIGRPDIEKWGQELVLRQDEKGIILRHHGVITVSDDPVKSVRLAAALEDIAYKTYIARSMGSLMAVEDNVVQRWNQRYMNDYGQK